MAGKTEKREKVSWLLHFLSSGKFDNPRSDENIEKMLRYVIFNIALIAGATFLVVFGLSVVMAGNTSRGILDIAFGLVCLTIVVLLRTNFPFVVCGLLALVPFGTLCVLFLLDGGERGFGML